MEVPWGVREVFKEKVIYEWTMEVAQELTWCQTGKDDPKEREQCMRRCRDEKVYGKF